MDSNFAGLGLSGRAGVSVPLTDPKGWHWEGWPALEDSETSVERCDHVNARKDKESEKMSSAGDRLKAWLQETYISGGNNSHGARLCQRCSLEVIL